MGTVIEGSVNDLFELAKKMHEKIFDFGANRIITDIKIDDRRDKNETINNKVESVLKKIQK